MASPAYERILEIQTLDQTIDQLRHRLTTHPAHERLREIDGELETHDAGVLTLEEERHRLQREEKRLQDETAMVEAKRTEIDGKLYGGEVTGSKDLLALQDEAAGLLERQTSLEDEELELMEELEGLSDRLQRRADERSVIEQRRETVQLELDQAGAEIEEELAGLTAKRGPLVDPSGGPEGLADLLSRYVELRSGYDGQPVARLVNSRCDGCHIQLSAVAVDQMAKMPEDAVVTCEECGRLLVR